MKKKILLIVLLIVILLGTGFAYAYFATDAFKTEKEIFFSYFLGNKAMEKTEVQEKLSEYLSKKENTTFTNKGEVTLNISGAGAAAYFNDDDGSLEMLNSSKIIFEGKTNTSKKLSEQTITMDFSQGFNIPIELKRDGDTYGIQSDFLDSKFIAIRNENLKALAERFEIDSTEIPDKIDMDAEKFTEEEIKILKEKYIKLLNDNLEDELFKKEKIDNQTIVTLSMTEKKATEVIINLLETIKSDEIILGKLDEECKTQFQNSIDDKLNELKEQKVSENNKIEIQMYIEGKIVKKYEIAYLENEQATLNAVLEVSENKITLKVYENSKLLLDVTSIVEKTENDVIVTAEAKLINEESMVASCTVTMQYKNLFALDNVEEIYDIKILYEDTQVSENTTTMGINFKNQIIFTPDAKIENLNKNNAITINDATDEELQTLILNIYKKFGLV